MYNHVVCVIVYFIFFQQSVQNLKLNLPDVCDVCVATPLKGKAFCRDHCSLLSKEAPDVPLDLHEFISYCQTKGTLPAPGLAKQ